MRKCQNERLDPFSLFPEILGTLADEQTLDALIEAMGDDDLAVRSAVVQALSAIKTEKAVAFLVRQLEQGDLRVASEAAIALAGQRSIAVPALIGMLGSGTAELQVATADILAKIGTDGVKSLLLTFEGSRIG